MRDVLDVIGAIWLLLLAGLVVLALFLAYRSSQLSRASRDESQGA